MNVVIDGLVKSGVLVALCLLGLALLRRASASARHLLLLATLAGLVALPLLAVLLPKWEVPGWQQQLPAAAQLLTATDQAMSATPNQTVPASTFPWWLAVWFAGSAAVGVRVLAGLVAIKKVRGSSVPMPDGSVRDSVTSLLNGREVEILLGEADRPPMTWGWFHPVLLLPSDCGSWPEDQLRSVVLHEIAHIDRSDWLTQLGSRVICAVYWFHPGIWLIAKRMEQESERAADDRVLNAGCRPEDYASHLLNVARSVRARRAIASVAMARKSPVSDRLEAVLASRRARAPLSRTGSASLALLVAGLLVAIAAAGPRLIRPSQPAPKADLTLSVASLGPDVEVTAHPVVADDQRTEATQGDDISDSTLDQAEPPPAPDIQLPDEAVAPDKPTAPTRVAWSARTKAKISRGIQTSESIAKAAMAKASEGTDEAMQEANHEIAMAAQEVQKHLKDVKIGEMNIDVPAVKVDVAEVHLDMPQIHVHVPAIHVQVPSIHVKVPMPSPKPDPSDAPDPSN